MRISKRSIARCLFGSVAALGLAAVMFGATAEAKDACFGKSNIALVNGKIHTMNKHNSIVSSAVIENGRFTSVGKHAKGHAPCTKVINLRGRTVVPGLIDNHNHIVLLGLRPGHDTRLENISSIGEVLDALQKRANGVANGQWITAIGGWNIAQFSENRLPTLTELDSASSDHPIYIQQSFTGPGATNSLGKAFFESKGITIGADGFVAPAPFFSSGPATEALFELRKLQTFEDKKRGTKDAIAYGLSVGITTHGEMGAFTATGTTSDGAAHFDPKVAFDPMLALNRAGELKGRVRIFFLTEDTTADLTTLKAKVENAFREFGDDMLRVTGLGEFIVGNWFFPGPAPFYVEAATLAAQKGWVHQQHTLSLDEDIEVADTFEAVNTAMLSLNPNFKFSDLHWSIAHVPFIDQPTIDRLKALGVGASVTSWRYLAGTPTQNGPPFRMLVDSGIRVGMSSDGMQIAPMNPWLNIFYIVTGKNSSGELINERDGVLQTLTRTEAMRLYTSNNGWFLKEEKKLGSIEKGKFADLVVLNKDYFNKNRVSDEGIKDLHSVLTIVGGKIVHDSRRRYGHHPHHH